MGENEVLRMFERFPRPAVNALISVGIAYLAVSIVRAQTPSPPTAQTAPSTKAKAATPAMPITHSPPNRHGREGMYYATVWGIDSLTVKWAESGELVRFTWRVVDPDRARLLNDKKNEPTLEDPRAGVSLVVPVLEKVGQLRQTAAPETGRSYWVAFSNAGRRVKQGDRVNVVIGAFRADNLVVN